MKKIAIDDAAKTYWKLLYSEYGEQLVRDIPRRIKAALFEKKKVASVNEKAELLPLAHVATEDGLKVEGMYNDGSTKLMFRADFNSDGDIVDIKYFDLK